MAKYVALLRGIAPMDPRMSNTNLRNVFTSLGFTNVATIIASGNVIFETVRTNVPALESMIEQTITAQLGFTSTTIIRSYDDIEHLVHKNPFAGYQHGPKTYLTVSFLKETPAVPLSEQPLPSHKAYTLVAAYDKEICTSTNTTARTAANYMAQVEKRFGKAITTRTWKTVERIFAKMQ